MKLDLDRLLAPVPGDDAAGPDLAYDPMRHMIDQAFDSSVSIDSTGIAEEKNIDWKAVISTIAVLSERTKDVWLPVYLCRAGAQTGQLEVVALGAQALAGLLEAYWIEVHPRLDEYGVQGRKGACDTLAAYREFVAPLGRVTLVDHERLGRFTADDIIRFHRGGDAEDGYGPFRATIEDTTHAGLAEAATALDTIGEALHRADEVLMRHAGEGSGTNFAPIYEKLGAVRAALDAFLPQPVPALDEVAEDMGEGATDIVETRVQATGGAVRTRADVIRMLDLVMDYYRRNEPTSPVPLLLDRAKSWVTGDFLAVLQDIAPGAIDEARHLLQARLSAQGDAF